MKHLNPRIALSLVAAAALAVAGCSSEDNDQPASTSATATTTSTTSSKTSSTTSSTTTSASPEAVSPEPAPAQSEPEAVQNTPAAEPAQQETPAAANTAPSAPVYGVPCSESQILQPTNGADGTSLVCVGMGGDNGQVWVYGPEGQGAGTATDGAACSEGEEGGQDESGRMMMCSNGQWVYGP